MKGQMVTANRLGDGAVVFLGADGRWVEHIDQGQALPDSEAEALLRIGEAATRTEVVGPYLIDVEVGADGGVTALRYRERIRAEGPSVPWLAGRKKEAK
jgi:uncharacterized protein DUF2849